MFSVKARVFGRSSLRSSLSLSVLASCGLFDLVYEARQSLASHSNLQTYLRSIFIYHTQREEPWTEDPILVTSVMRTRVRALRTP
ncbi:hypothetical protein K1719_037498 [Acacia pycnantha]|nr:hypothetical protein K1719_037498 [Acacia pycnantha]